MTFPHLEREYDPVTEYFTGEPGYATGFLRELSDESRLGHLDYGELRTVAEGCYRGEELAEQLEPGQGQGAYIAVYRWQDVEDLSSPGENELYLAISEGITEDGFEDHIPKSSLTVIEGYDESMTTSELCELANSFFNSTEP